jgi:UDP-glucose 4-epimerase
MARVIVTGASGFVGRAVCRVLAARGHEVTAVVRREAADLPGRTVVCDLGGDDRWHVLFKDVDAVIHAAGLAHVRDARGRAAEAAFRAANVALVKNIALAAAAARVPRFVHFSTVKVMGETSGPTPFTEDDPPHPSDAYARSKHESEIALDEVAQAWPDTAVAVLRLPLVYGPGVKANFARLLSLVDSPWPLPFADIPNRRSLVALENVADAVRALVEAAEPARGPFFIADDRVLSTSELVTLLRAALGRPSRLFPVPWRAASAMLVLVGRAQEAERLFASLEVDCTRFRTRLGWRPPVAVEAALALTARAWRDGRR